MVSCTARGPCAELRLVLAQRICFHGFAGQAGDAEAVALQGLNLALSLEFYALLSQAKLEKPKRLREAAGRDWGEIEHGSLRWVTLAAAGWGIHGADESTETMLPMILGSPDNLQRCEPCLITAQRLHAHNYIVMPTLQL